MRRSLLAPAFIVLCVLAWFAPVLLGGRVFISDNTMPGFFQPVQLWSDLLYSGFPLFADPTFANAYPVRIVLSAITPLLGQASAYNLYVCSAYAIAGLATYAYLREVTRDEIAAMVSGLAFSFSGFLQAHLGHETITHTAAWLPALVWATHRVMLGSRSRDVALLAIFAALAYLGNHPQITFHDGLVAGLYALFLASQADRPVTALVRFAAAWALGIAAVAVQLVPSWENGSLSMRGAPPTAPTLEGSLPMDQVMQLAMPWIFGGYPPSLVAPIAGFGNKMFAEIANYIPAMVLMLGAGAFLGAWRRVAIFWAALAALFFILTLGPQTIAGVIRFHAPVFNLFNNPGRDILAVHFAVAVLAGLGIAALRRREWTTSLVTIAAVAGSLPTIAALALYPVVVRKGQAAGIVLPSAWTNTAVIVPLVLCVFSIASLVLAWRSPRAAPLALLVVTVVAGCGYFGWFAPWRLYSGPARAALEEPRDVAEVVRLRRDPNERVLTADGWIGPTGMNPNSSMMFALPNVAGYGPLLPRLYAEAVGLTNSGWINPQAFRDGNSTLDLLGVRWIFPHADDGKGRNREVRAGIEWDPQPLDRYIGGTCGGPGLRRTLDLALPSEIAVTRVALVTALACGLEVPDGEAVASISLSHRGEWVGDAVPLRAGQDTAEWSAACGQGTQKKTHRLAPIFDSEPARGVPGCLGHRYLADLRMPTANADALRIEWLGGAHPASLLYVKHITVFDDQGHSFAVGDRDQMFRDRSHWASRTLPSGAKVVENFRAMPAAWLAPQTVQVATDADALSIMHSGILADGRPYDARTHAILSAAVSPSTHATTIGNDASVSITQWEGASKQFEIDSGGDAILVVSDRFHPGWSATVDGAAAPVLKVDAVLQGVAVGRGRHAVSLRYRPTHFYLLAALSILAGGIILLLVAARRRTPEPQ